MAYDWTRLTEATTTTAASLNDRFGSVRMELNALESIAPMPRGLHRQHLQSTVRAKGRAVIQSNVNHLYTSTNEPYPGYGIGSSWRVINTNGSAGTGTALLITFASPVDLSDIDLYGGILVMANVHMITMTVPASTIALFGAQAMFAIQYQISGTWYTLGRSERFASADTNQAGSSQLTVFKDIPIRTYITQADVAGKGNEQVTAVRMVTSINNTNVAVKTLALRQGQITALALRAGAL